MTQTNNGRHIGEVGSGNRSVGSAVEPCPYLRRGSVLIMTDLMTDEGNRMEDRYTLSSTDGGYARTLTTKNDSVPGDEWVSLLFDDVPTDKCYTLCAALHNGHEFILLEDVPYDELGEIPRRLQPMIDREPDEGRAGRNRPRRNRNDAS